MLQLFLDVSPKTVSALNAAQPLKSIARIFLCIGLIACGSYKLLVLLNRDFGFAERIFGDLHTMLRAFVEAAVIFCHR